MGRVIFPEPRRLLAVLAAMLAWLPAVAHAGDGGTTLFSSDTLSLYGDVRAVAVNGETAWSDDGFGKLRYGGDDPARPGDMRLRARFGEAGIVWQPKFGWALTGTVVALAQGGGAIEHRLDAGLSEAYVTYKPLGGGPVRLSARAGLMYPPVSLEHSGAQWAVTDTVTPSAIGSWIGEEVKVVGLEATISTHVGGHALALTLAGFDGNDTAGALLTYRGWALHDRKALAFRTQPLPPLNDFMGYVQPRFSHPLLDVDPGVLHRPGYYAKLTWQLPQALRIEALHYDNDGNPQAVNEQLEWGWRTKFDAVGAVVQLPAELLLRAQALSGRTRMGDDIGGVAWIDMRFRAAYGMLTRNFARGSISARVDVFGTRNHGSAVDGQDDEDGWALTTAARRELGSHVTGLVEYLHVDSHREARSRAGLGAQQAQDQMQFVVRARW